MDCVDRIFTLVDAKYQEQRNFAYDLGLPPSIISEWRRRRSASYNKRLPQIAEVLGVSAEYLLTGEEKKPTVLDDEGPTAEEWALLLAYRAADNRTRQMVDLALEPWKKSDKPDLAI